MPTAKQISVMPFFVAACSRLGIEPTMRQARKAKQGAAQWAGSQVTACLQNLDAQPEKEAA